MQPSKYPQEFIQVDLNFSKHASIGDKREKGTE
jgi:hypothetical protein